MCEFSAIAIQTVNPGESVVFTETVVPCRRGFIRHREGAGNFLLSGAGGMNCCCNQNRGIDYSCTFGANIAVPAEETAGPISLAITIDGATIPASEMVVTPAAVEEYFNVSREINVDIWRGCCETVTVRNTSSIPILVSAANIKFERSNGNF